MCACVRVCVICNCVRISPPSFVTAQSNDKMLVGGLLSDADVNAQYMSVSSNTFKSFVVDPASTRKQTDRYLRNRYTHMGIYT